MCAKCVCRLELCIDAERRFAARFGSVEELLIHVLQELLRDKAAQMDESPSGG